MAVRKWAGDADGRVTPEPSDGNQTDQFSGCSRSFALFIRPKRILPGKSHSMLRSTKPSMMALEVAELVPSRDALLLFVKASADQQGVFVSS